MTLYLLLYILYIIYIILKPKLTLIRLSVESAYTDICPVWIYSVLQNYCDVRSYGIRSYGNSIKIKKLSFT